MSHTLAEDKVVFFVFFVGGEWAVLHLVEVEVGAGELALGCFFLEEVVEHDSEGLPLVALLRFIATIDGECSVEFGVGFSCSPPLVMGEVAVEAEEVFGILSVWDGHSLEAPRAVCSYKCLLISFSHDFEHTFVAPEGVNSSL